MAQLSHQAGFYGVVKLAPSIAPAAASVNLLATGGNVNLNHDPIFSSGVWGAGWYNAATQVAYAFNVLTVDGSVDFELTEGDVLASIKNFAFEQRADGTAPNVGFNIIIWPNGAAGYQGKCWCTGCSFSASTDSAVTGNFSFMTDDSTGYTTADQTGSRLGPSGGTLPFATQDALFPYWATKVLTGVTQQKAIDWNATYTSNFQFLTICGGKTAAPTAPDYLVVGPMEANGSFTVFGLTSEVDPTAFHTIKDLTISMRAQSALSSAAHTIQFGKILYNSSGVNVTTGGDYIQVSVDFTAIGDGTKPPMALDPA